MASTAGRPALDRVPGAAEEARRRLAFMAGAADLLSAELDLDATLTEVARLAVPTLADWCRVDLRDDRARTRRVAIACADPQNAELARQLQGRAAGDGGGLGPAARALETGRSQLSPELSDAHLAAIATDAEELALLRRLSFRSAMIVPLRARGRVLGALAFFMAESGRRYGPGDLVLGEDLALRAAMALDNLRLDEELDEAVRLRDHILTAAAHDLKTPLTAIKVTAQLLGRLAARLGGEVGERVGQAAGRIDANTGRAVALIDELLDVASLQAGLPLRLNRGPTDLAALTRSVATELAETAPLHRIAVAAEGAIVGRWDAARLGRVIATLLASAVRLSPRGGPIVAELALELDDLGSSWAVVRVADRRHSMTAEERGRLFERFRPPARAERPIAGTAIGLFGARQIVEQHGGAIVVTSGEGIGTTFTVRLAVEAPPEE